MGSKKNAHGRAAIDVPSATRRYSSLQVDYFRETSQYCLDESFLLWTRPLLYTYLCFLLISVATRSGAHAVYCSPSFALRERMVFGPLRVVTSFTMVISYTTSVGISLHFIVVPSPLSKSSGVGQSAIVLMSCRFGWVGIP